MSVKHNKGEGIQITPYPTEKELNFTRDILKPPGIMSNNYNKNGLKKVKRPFISAKDSTTLTDGQRFYQTNYQGEVDVGKDLKYFDVTTQRHAPRLFDRINQTDLEFNQKLHRDDRKHAKSHDLCVNKEEKARRVPATSNSVYGHRTLSLEKVNNRHNHVDICRQDFQRINGVSF